MVNIECYIQHKFSLYRKNNLEILIRLSFKVFLTANKKYLKHFANTITAKQVLSKQAI